MIGFIWFLICQDEQFCCKNKYLIFSSQALYKSFCLNQLAELHKLMVEAAAILNIEPPDLYIRQSPVPNAYTLAISGKKPFVVVHTSLVELLTRKELQVYFPPLFTLHAHVNWSIV